MRTEDGYIIQKCLDGNAAAFGLLVDKYKKGIYALAYSEVQNFHDAQDITQEVFIKVYKNLRSLRRWDNFVGWLFRVTTNTCRNWVRSESRRPDSEFLDNQEFGFLEKPAVNSYQANMVNELVQDALSSLPEMYRQVLTLRYFGGMKVNEMSRFLGVSPRTIDRRLKEAHAQIKGELLAMLSINYEYNQLPANTTFRIVEMVKRIKIQPIPRITGLSLGLSLAAGIIIAVFGLNPYINIFSEFSMSSSSSLPADVRALKTGVISVEILKTSEISIFPSDQNNGSKEISQMNFHLAPQRDEGGKWVEKANMSNSRYAMAAAVAGDRVYVIGGYKRFSFINAVEMYDPINDIWETKSPISRGNLGVAAASVNGKVYAMGGWGQGEPRANWGKTVGEYDPATDKWTRKTNAPTSRNWATTAVVDGIIYVIGGGGDVTWIPTVEAYDPVADKWTKKADLPMPAGCYAAVAGGKIYIMGIRTPEQKMHPDVYEYDPKFDTWTRKADMPTPRMGISTVTVGERYIYAIGGTSDLDQFNIVTTVEIYDTKTDTWDKGVDLLEPRAYHVSAIAAGEIYVIGGADVWPEHGGNAPPNSVVARVESFELDDTEVLGVSPQNKFGTTWGNIKNENISTKKMYSDGRNSR